MGRSKCKCKCKCIFSSIRKLEASIPFPQTLSAIHPVQSIVDFKCPLLVARHWINCSLPLIAWHLADSEYKIQVTESCRVIDAGNRSEYCT